MTKFTIAIVAIGLVIFGLISGGTTKLVILIGVAVAMVGFAFHGLFTSKPTEVGLYGENAADGGDD